MEDMKQRALGYLRKALNNPSASFRKGQWESIKGLLDGKRILVVQSTGWGKSMVYFIATKLLREQGAGLTLLISPLLALMRNQLEAADRVGIQARTINSSNTAELPKIEAEINNNSVDILLISPERLANSKFNKFMENMKIGLFVVDEAHCISDWGHDFRPDYRRIIRVIQSMPDNTPVLTTTATANKRVRADVKSQLTTPSNIIYIQRGSLVRTSLKLQNISMPSSTARMAWLAQTLPALTGSGIIYTLTIRDAETVAKWLKHKGINAVAYHGNKNEQREELEQKLLNNKVKALVATVALGMGFDKPDLGFVIHYQRPSSVVHYYQQVGRAGRAVDEAFGILLGGEEDDHIADYFIKNAFPPQQHIKDIIRVLDQSDNGLSLNEILNELNLNKGQVEKALKYLTIESPAPIIMDDHKWRVTATARSYKTNQAHVDKIIKIRRKEQSQMQEYMEHGACLMAFLQAALDDPDPKPCGKCRNCNPTLLLNEAYDHNLAEEAVLWLKGVRSYQKIIPIKEWPNNLEQFDGIFKAIKPKFRAAEGRTLCLWRDGGWGDLVRKGKYIDHRFSDELVDACVDMLQSWNPSPRPKWVTCIPSIKHPELVSNFTARLAKKLELPFVPCIKKVRENMQQKKMENSIQKVNNLVGVFEVADGLSGECILVDDMVDSGWTFTAAAAKLRQSGCTAVYPLALALNSPRTY